MNYNELKRTSDLSFEEAKYEESITLYQKCIELQPEETVNYWYLGLAYLLLGEELEAQTVWMSIILEDSSQDSEQLIRELVEILEVETRQQIAQGNLAIAKIIYQEIAELEPNYNLEQLAGQAIREIYKSAEFLALTNQYEQAEAKYLEILSWHEYYLPAWSDLAIIYYQKSEYEKALQAITNCLKINPSVGLHYLSLGLILEKLENFSEASKMYAQAIELNPQLVIAYNNLGNLWEREGKIGEAEAIYRQAIDFNDSHFLAYVNLGNILIKQEKIEEAIEIYQKALRLQPHNPYILEQLAQAWATNHQLDKYELYKGYTNYYQGKYLEAISHFKNFLSFKTGDVELYLSLAQCYKNLNQEAEVIEICQEALTIYPYQVNIYGWFIRTLQNFGRVEEAINIVNRDQELNPHNLFLKRVNQWILPVIYEQPEEIEFYRERYSKYLDELIEATNISSDFSDRRSVKAYEASQYETNFYLQYQGKNDLELQKKYGNWLHKVLATKFPQFGEPLPKRKNEKIRIGYISAYFRNHTIAHLTKGWLKKAKRNVFEIYCYYTDSQNDYLTQECKSYSDVFYYLPEDLETACQQIIKDQLQIIIYPTLGLRSDTRTLSLAALRLAPVQCVSWGHPVTTGLPTIDYFLSSDLMEPEKGEEDYSEKLIRLPNLSIYYSQPELPKSPKKRQDFQFNEEDIIYLSCQSLYKYLPQYDYIFAAIAQKVTMAKFAFIVSHISDSITEKFKQRLQRAFAIYHLNSEDYCIFLPRLTQEDYMNVNLLSDVYLDTLDWSGGNTTLHAITCNLPVVTCRGQLMRSRHSYAMLKMMDITETIAQNETEYINIAVGLGLDLQWRDQIKQKTTENKLCLYEDDACIKALEQFFRQVVEERD